jgi:hypothetical protein
MQNHNPPDTGGGDWEEFENAQHPLDNPQAEEPKMPVAKKEMQNQLQEVNTQMSFKVLHLSPMITCLYYF